MFLFACLCTHKRKPTIKGEVRNFHKSEFHHSKTNMIKFHNKLFVCELMRRKKVLAPIFFVLWTVRALQGVYGD